MLSRTTTRRTTRVLTSQFISLKTNTQTNRGFSLWAHVPLGPRDPIIGVTEQFKEDTSKRKLNLGVGAYRDDQNKPVVLKSVKEAQHILFHQSLDNEYAPIAGDAEFIQYAVQLAYGQDHPLLQQRRVAAIQALSGTGALRLAAAFLARFDNTNTSTLQQQNTNPPSSPLSAASAYKSLPLVYVPNPTWSNHNTIFNDCGFEDNLNIDRFGCGSSV